MNSFDQKAMEEAVAVFHKRVQQPRKLGTNDCCLVISEVLKPVWGVDLMRGIRGVYASEKGMVHVIRKMLKVDCFADAVEQVLKERGAVRLDEGQFSSFQDFDFGIGLLHQAGEDIVLPAFYWQGQWFAMTDTGFATLSVIAAAWRYEGGSE